MLKHRSFILMTLFIAVLFVSTLACSQSGRIITAAEATEMAKPTAVPTAELQDGFQVGDVVYLTNKSFLVSLMDAPGSNKMIAGQERGVQVEILLPEKNNLAFVQWASTGMLWQVLQQGCRVYAVPPPFDHSKLMVVDGVWALIGSANWDPRSLRLNFEFNVEVYDRALAGELHDYMGQKIAQSREISLDDLAQRPMRIQLRDGIARLFSPYM